MKTNAMQFDGDGGYDTPLNSGATSAAAAAPVRDESDDRMARASAAQARSGAAAGNAATASVSKPSSVNTTNLAGVEAASVAPTAAASGYASAATDLGSSAKKVKAPKAIDKSAWDRGTKVSQKMVDYVKSEGRGNMGAVPQGKVKNGAPGYNGSTFDNNAPVGAEYKEAVKRIYPNGAPASKAAPKAADKPKIYGGAAADKYKGEKNRAENPFSKSTGGGMPKIAAPKTKIETVKKLRNAEIVEANKQAPKNDQVAYAIINGLKGGAEAYGAGTQNRSQISGTQTKTQKAQAEYKAKVAANKKAAEKKNK